MPKRPLTPPPGDDEPKYLTICYPYPPHANMEIPGERLALARWLACCMGAPDDLYAIFHKPSAPNMIIIEVRRDYPRFRQLLGAHKWSEFVRSPGEHSDKVTRIYFSTFPSGRAVEKAGWKRIFVADEWFKGFSPNNKYITHPYPISRYCDIPSENQTAFKLCRPIPRETFLIQVSTPPPVPVGSAGWVAHKDNADGINRSYAVVTPPSLLELHIPASSALKGLTSSPGRSDLSISNADNGTGSLGCPSPVLVNFHGSSSVGTPQSAAKTGLPPSTSEHLASLPSESKRSFIPSDGPFCNGGVAPFSKDGRGGGEVTLSASIVEDEFGSLSLYPPANKDGIPICPSHGVVCKKGICRDYARLLKKTQREEKQVSYNDSKRGHMRGGASSDGHLFVTGSRGKPNYGARGFNSTRGTGWPKGGGFPKGRGFSRGGGFSGGGEGFSRGRGFSRGGDFSRGRGSPRSRVSGNKGRGGTVAVNGPSTVAESGPSFA